MAIVDAVESPSSTSQFPFHFSHHRHFYVAVDRLQFKMETLVDLLGVAGRRPGLPMVVCCSSRDELDAVCSTVYNLPYISVSPLYSDQVESERTLILEQFRRAAVTWSQNIGVATADESEEGKDEGKSHMIVATDVCLPLLASGESSILARVLINYELPTKKKAADMEVRSSAADMEETYARRMATCLAADGIVINVVVGGEVVTLKSIEESSSLVIAEMPIHISEIL